MINPFQKIGDMAKLRSQAMKIQKELGAERVTIDKNGVHIVMSGDQKVVELTVDGRYDKRLLEAVNEAIKKSQEIAAKKMQAMGGLDSLLGK
jgi:DNA-binding protein YbaB